MVEIQLKNLSLDDVEILLQALENQKESDHYVDLNTLSAKDKIYRQERRDVLKSALIKTRTDMLSSNSEN